MISILISIYLTGIVFFSRSFAHIYVRIGSLPVYITEALIIVLFSYVLIKVLVQKIYTFKSVFMWKWYLALYIIGFFSMYKGLTNYDDHIFVARHSAIIYYTVFYFASVVFLDFVRLKYFYLFIYISSVILSIVSICNISFFGLGNNGVYYICFGLIIGISFLNKLYNYKTKILFSIFTIIQLYAILQDHVRAVWVGLAMSILFFIVVMLAFKEIRLEYMRNLSIVAKSIILLAILLFIFNPKTVKSFYSEVLSIFMVNVDNTKNISIANAKWRLYVWNDIIEETMEKPLTGWGFGKKFIPPTIKKLNWGGSWREPDKLFQDPHNSFLSVFHRTGFLGLAVFLYIVIGTMFNTVKYLKALKNDNIIIPYLIASVVISFYIFGVSLFMVVLEGPQLGIFLWIFLGIQVFLIRMCEQLNDIVKK